MVNLVSLLLITLSITQKSIDIPRRVGQSPILTGEVPLFVVYGTLLTHYAIGWGMGGRGGRGRGDWWCQINVL